MNNPPRYSWGLSAALLFTAVALAPQQVMAQGLSVAVIDFDAAVKDNPFFEKRTAEQESRQKGYQAQITAQEKKAQDIEADRDAFRRGSPEWASKHEEWEAAMSLYQSRGRRLVELISDENRRIYLELSKTVDQALGDFARERKYDLVLRRWPLDRLQSSDDEGLLISAFQTRDLLFNAPHLDKTQDFIDFLQSWEPSAKAVPAKAEVDKGTAPAKTGK